MPTPAERSALLFVASIAALGVGVRGCRALRPTPVPVESREALARQIAAVDSAVAAGGRRRSSQAAKPTAVPRSAPAEPRLAAPKASGRAAVATGAARVGAPTLVDVDRAGAAELESLPGIGPALAARIIANRDSAGAYGSLEGLQQVRGIGPALAARLAPHVTFSGLPRPPQTGRSGARRTHP